MGFMMGGRCAGGVLDRIGPGPVDDDIDPRLCGNCSGRGREWVRSNKPHLLQSWCRRSQTTCNHGEEKKRRIDAPLCLG